MARTEKVIMTNMYFTHVFTYSALTDGFAGFAKFLSDFRSTVILF